jgi:hypothetical protein
MKRVPAITSDAVPPRLSMPPPTCRGSLRPQTEGAEVTTNDEPEIAREPVRPPRVRPGIAPALVVFVVYLLAVLALNEVFASDVA